MMPMTFTTDPGAGAGFFVFCVTVSYTNPLLFWFFEYACGICGYANGVNPFDQPGVEFYKRNMFRLLGKPGYENK